MSTDCKKDKDLNKVATVANRILIIFKTPVKLIIREIIFSRRLFLIFPEIPNVLH